MRPSPRSPGMRYQTMRSELEPEPVSGGLVEEGRIALTGDARFIAPALLPRFGIRQTASRLDVTAGAAVLSCGL